MKTKVLLGLSLGIGVVAVASVAAPRAKVAPIGATARPAPWQLTGVWQAAPSMGAGWANTYRFFADGRVQYHLSQMDCQARERGWSGRWRIEGKQIVLRIERTTRTVGGHLQKATGACGTPLELVGGRKITRRKRRAIRRMVSWSGVRPDESNGRAMTILGNEHLWRFDSNPQNYR